MDHTHIVQAADLARYADTRESEAVIPELIYLLVKQSVSTASLCRIPYGDAINQSGADGLLEADEGFLEFVPRGRSYWEIGTGRDPRKKATEDFQNRTDSLSETDRMGASFVFVTPRSAPYVQWDEPSQTKWLERRKNHGWKLIRIIDGVKLADWLREFPALGRWMAKKMGITPSLGGISTPSEHWERISPGDKSEPSLPPALFTSSRSSACDALEAAFRGEAKHQRLLFFTESEHDVDDFVAAYLASLEKTKASEFSNRCLFISEENAWHSVVEARRSHVLVASRRLGLDSEKQDLQTVATRKGHVVIIPLCGAYSGESPEIIKLRSPSRSQIENILKEAGFPEIRARELAAIGDGRISALRRHRLGLGVLPPYATWDSARQLSQAGLPGQWDSANEADIEAMEKLLGKDYGEWIETLSPDALRSDSPLLQRDAKWEFVARGEAWNALGNRITDDDLDRLKQVAVTVLGERDPKFDLPKEERFAATFHGKSLKHSSFLREGLAETLALVGSRPKALSHCSFNKAETTATLVVQRLLSEASWDRWASLESLLPLLAEAAPDEFLRALETSLEDIDNCPFHEVFAQEGNDAIGDSSYISGLLWALESLAWNPDYLSRIAVVLADIASIDPGGNLLNRPANSLINIFIPWHVQTTASFEKRQAAIETVLREQPTVGWKLLLSLMPNNHGITLGCHQPIWRDYIPHDCKNDILQSEYWEQIAVFTKLAIELAKEDVEKLGELITHLPDLPKSAYESLLDYLTSDMVVELPLSERFPIWEKLQSLVRQHRRFADARWALPEEAVQKMEHAASLLVPQTSALKYQHLFSGSDSELFDENDNYDEQHKRLAKNRQDVVKTILREGDLTAALTFARNVSDPYEVGVALGVVVSKELEDEILPSQLSPETETVSRVVAGFVRARYWEHEWNWVDAVLERNWNVRQKAAFLVLLPFEEAVWNLVSAHLGAKDEALYWQDARVNPYGAGRDLTVAIEKLLEYGRPADSVLCVSRTVNDEDQFDQTLATRALLSVLDNPSTLEQLDTHQTVALITRLQKSPDADQDALYKIEWNFLPWLNQFSSGSPITLENRLASDPAFFAEVVALVFRSKNDEKKDAQLDEQEQSFAHNAYRLLTEWETCPGVLDNGLFNADVFNAWIDETRRITEETGHKEVAQIQIGHVLTHAPADPNGLWIHETVASALNGRDTESMRLGFTTELSNQRGVHSFTGGRDERELARQNREKADALDVKRYSRFATAMRRFAQGYERDAEYQANRDPFDE